MGNLLLPTSLLTAEFSKMLKQRSCVMLFIDFKKAFDSIHRGILMKILRAYRLPEAIVALIQKMYTGTLAKVIT